LCVGAFIGIFAEHKLGLFREPPELIPISVPPPPITNIPIKLQANVPPDLAHDVATQGARYLLLDDLIELAKSSRKIAETYGYAYRDSFKPITYNYNGVSLARSRFQANAELIFSAILKDIKSINDRAYVNRSLDLQSVPELSIPTMVAPGEDAFSSNDDATNIKKYNFRRIHFLIPNVLKQADALINDMQFEKNEITSALRKSAEGKRFMTRSQ
jgi:hypothetical protein